LLFIVSFELTSEMLIFLLELDVYLVHNLIILGAATVNQAVNDLLVDFE
jgi:hypothetical protein